MHIVIARSLASTKIGGSVGLCCIKVKKTSNKVQWKSPKIYVHPGQRYDKGFISFVWSEKEVKEISKSEMVFIVILSSHNYSQNFLEVRVYCIA